MFRYVYHRMFSSLGFCSWIAARHAGRWCTWTAAPPQPGWEPQNRNGSMASWHVFSSTVEKTELEISRESWPKQKKTNPTAPKFNTLCLWVYHFMNTDCSCSQLSRPQTQDKLQINTAPGDKAGGRQAQAAQAVPKDSAWLGTLIWTGFIIWIWWRCVLLIKKQKNNHIGINHY